MGVVEIALCPFLRRHDGWAPAREVGVGVLAVAAFPGQHALIEGQPITIFERTVPTDAGCGVLLKPADDFVHRAVEDDVSTGLRRKHQRGKFPEISAGFADHVIVYVDVSGLRIEEHILAALVVRICECVIEKNGELLVCRVVRAHLEGMGRTVGLNGIHGHRLVVDREQGRHERQRNCPAGRFLDTDGCEHELRFMRAIGHLHRLRDVDGDECEDGSAVRQRTGLAGAKRHTVGDDADPRGPRINRHRPFDRFPAFPGVVGELVRLEDRTDRTTRLSGRDEVVGGRYGQVLGDRQYDVTSLVLPRGQIRERDGRLILAVRQRLPIVVDREDDRLLGAGRDGLVGQVHVDPIDIDRDHHADVLRGVHVGKKKSLGRGGRFEPTARGGVPRRRRRDNDRILDR